MARRGASFVLASLALAVASVVACGDDPAPVTEPAPQPVIEAGVVGDAAAAKPLCVDGKPTVAYPPGPYELAALGLVPAGLSFADADGATIRIDDFFEPCAPRSRVLVVRSSAAWCGTCLWQVAHTKRFMEDPRFAGRLLLVDLLIADHDNVPAKTTDLAKWREQIDLKDAAAAAAAAVSKLAIDPTYTFGPALPAREPLPEYVFIDTKTMMILSTMSDPDPESLAGRLAIEFADLDKTARPPAVSPTLTDGYFTENQMDLVRAMKLPASFAPPTDPTNEYGDVPAAVTLGKALFSDKLLSPSGTISCASCHDPNLDLTDGVSTSTGISKVDRNSPAIALASHSRWQFWDGHADTLWMQALGPPEDAKEFGSSRLFVAHQIVQRYAAQYDAVFGVKYPLPAADIGAMPASGKPGDATYDALSAANKDQVTRVYVNVGKAIAAFERAIRVKPNALDRYIGGETTALTNVQKHALVMFFKNGCAQCHWGPRMTDDAFHIVRFGTGRQDGTPDFGREDGLLKLAASEFTAASKWSDSPTSAKSFDATNAQVMLGAFKTPTLRGLPTSAPYGHGGTLTTLGDVAHQYGIRGLEHADSTTIGSTEQWLPSFDAIAQRDLATLMELLSGQVELP